MLKRCVGPHLLRPAAEKIRAIKGNPTWLQIVYKFCVCWFEICSKSSRKNRRCGFMETQCI